MAVTYLIGKPGSGKTSIVWQERAMPLLRELVSRPSSTEPYRRVVCNFRVDLYELADQLSCTIEHLRPCISCLASDDMLLLWGRTDGVDDMGRALFIPGSGLAREGDFVIWDEASQQLSEHLGKALKDRGLDIGLLFDQHRKLRLDIYVVIQRLDCLPKPLRGAAETYIRARNSRKGTMRDCIKLHSALDWFIGDLPWMIQQIEWDSFDRPPGRFDKPQSTELYFISDRTFAVLDSHAKHGSVGSFAVASNSLAQTSDLGPQAEAQRWRIWIQGFSFRLFFVSFTAAVVWWFGSLYFIGPLLGTASRNFPVMLWPYNHYHQSSSPSARPSLPSSVASASPRLSVSPPSPVAPVSSPVSTSWDTKPKTASVSSPRPSRRPYWWDGSNHYDKDGYIPASELLPGWRPPVGSGTRWAQACPWSVAASVVGLSVAADASVKGDYSGSLDKASIIASSGLLLDPSGLCLIPDRPTWRTFPAEGMDKDVLGRIPGVYVVGESIIGSLSSQASDVLEKAILTQWTGNCRVAILSCDATDRAELSGSGTLNALFSRSGADWDFSVGLQASLLNSRIRCDGDVNTTLVSGHKSEVLLGGELYKTEWSASTAISGTGTYSTRPTRYSLGHTLSITPHCARGGGVVLSVEYQYRAISSDTKDALTLASSTYSGTVKWDGKTPTSLVSAQIDQSKEGWLFFGKDKERRYIRIVLLPQQTALEGVPDVATTGTTPR